MVRGSIPRTAVLLTLGSAYLTWFALTTALGLMAPQSGTSALLRLALAAGAALIAAALFVAAQQLSWWAADARAREKAIPIPVTVRARRVRR